MKLLFLLLALTLMSCGCIQYVSDIGTMSSAQANSPEFMIKINGRVCSNGHDTGLCIEKVKQGADIALHVDPLPYTYEMAIDCTDAISSDESFTVKSNDPFDQSLKHANFDDSVVFNCTFTATPADRKVSMFAALRIYVISAQYIPLETPYKNIDGKIIFGEHAYLAITEDGVYNKVTMTSSKNTAIVESEAGKRAYYGIK